MDTDEDTDEPSDAVGEGSRAAEWVDRLVQSFFGSTLCRSGVRNRVGASRFSTTEPRRWPPRTGCMTWGVAHGGRG